MICQQCSCSLHAWAWWCDWQQGWAGSASPGYLLPPAAGGSKPSAAAEAVAYGSPLHQAIDVSDGQIPYIVFYTDELAATWQSSNLLHLLRKETIMLPSSLWGFLYATSDCVLNESRNQFAASLPQLNQTYSQFLLSKKHPVFLHRVPTVTLTRYIRALAKVTMSKMFNFLFFFSFTSCFFTILSPYLYLCELVLLLESLPARYNC